MMTHERLSQIRHYGLWGCDGRTIGECLDEIERLDNITRIQQKQIERLLAARDIEKEKADKLQAEVDMLKESRAACVAQEQVNRVGWNNARSEIERLECLCQDWKKLAGSIVANCSTTEAHVAEFHRLVTANP